MLLIIDKSIQAVWSSAYSWSSSPRCNLVRWSNLWRIFSIAPITTSLLFHWTLPQEMPNPTAHKTTSVALTKNTKVVTTILGVGRKLTTPLCHTTLWICRFRSGILTIVLTIVLTCRCTRRWWDRTLLYLFDWWPISITLLLSGLISCLSSLVSILFYVPQLLLFNLLHINHQPGYVHVSYQYCNSSLFVWCMTQNNYKLAHLSPDVLNHLRSIFRQLGELESTIILTQKVRLQGRKLAYVRPFQFSRK